MHKDKKLKKIAEIEKQLASLKKEIETEEKILEPTQIPKNKLYLQVFDSGLRIRVNGITIVKITNDGRICYRRNTEAMHNLQKVLANALNDETVVRWKGRNYYIMTNGTGAFLYSKNLSRNATGERIFNISQGFGNPNCNDKNILKMPWNNRPIIYFN